MLFATVAATSEAVGATSSRSAKSAALGACLRDAAPDERAAVVGFLVGDPRQGRTGIGWRTIQRAADDRPPAVDPTLTVTEVDQALTALAGLAGPGSAGTRLTLLGDLFARATPVEAAFLARLLGGELRQGALAGVMVDAVAKAADVPIAAVRRAVMLDGRLEVVAGLAFTAGRAGLEAVTLTVHRPLQPMLASTAASATEAVEALGSAAVEWKLDGIRIQVHRAGDRVSVYTRNLNDITARLPEVVRVARALPVESVVLDGEALVLDAAGRPALFQDTAAQVGADEGTGPHAVPRFFDLLHLDGRDLLDQPLRDRRAALAAVAGDWHVPGVVTDDPAVAEAVLADALAAGHEGVVVKGADSRYEAGRRGKTWRKVKPVHSLDLVVLAVEWGYGRRTGWLSNLHLGARSDTDPDRFVMVGKTFKGLTDALLTWQTARFLDLAVDHEHGPDARHGTVQVRPEQLVEVAVDGVQRSTRYPGGVALRFARVVRYRDDKPVAEADTVAAVAGLLAR